MLDVLQPKQFDLHLVLGEAIMTAALGPNSPECRDKWLVGERDFKSPHPQQSETVVSRVLKGLLSERVTSPNPHIRQVSGGWAQWRGGGSRGGGGGGGDRDCRGGVSEGRDQWGRGHQGLITVLEIKKHHQCTV